MTDPEPGPERVRKLLAGIAAKQAEMLPQSRWVGRDFANAARAMHEGRVAGNLIHGQASPDEAAALRDDGIAALPLLVPLVPPVAANLTKPFDAPRPTPLHDRRRTRISAGSNIHYLHGV